MKKKQNKHPLGVSALQIILALSLMSMSAVLLASGFRSAPARGGSRSVLVVNPAAHRGVQRGQDAGTVGLLGGDRHPHRSPCPLHVFAVLLGQVFAVFVEYREAHDVETHLDVADLLHLENPARRNPAPRAQRVEPEIGHRLFGHCRFLSSKVTDGQHIAQHNRNRRAPVPQPRYPAHSSTP